ncbi:helix-turn-helix domain-containing protein [Pseudomonas sp. Marseille-Q5115]|uniref:helix-turn-helix domain-containing protein n=1 Tax=Pseudomonas sp. Marseille-Q5115 TaxID=2866593 RepID=UPI001CE3EE20|nr:helix-turn-helix domain-containing protein [Pseudomonas sp. Marseille-Q5115]
MTAIGSRIREERERLRLTQRAFGEIGGVEPNAQGKYESGERWPKADYLAAVADHGVDVLYVLTGARAAEPADQLSEDEASLLRGYRSLPAPAQAALAGMAEALVALVPARNPDGRRGR